MKKQNQVKLSLILLVLASALLLSSCGSVYKGTLNRVNETTYTTTKNDTVRVTDRLDDYLSSGGVWKVWVKDGKAVHIREYMSSKNIKKYSN